MNDVFSVLFAFFRWVFEATLKDAATEEGAAKLKGILDALEAAGVDVPFYEPDAPPQPSEGEVDSRAHAARSREQRRADAATRRALHEEALQR